MHILLLLPFSLSFILKVNSRNFLPWSTKLEWRGVREKLEFCKWAESWSTIQFSTRSSSSSHYSKSQIFVQKFNFDKTPTFSRVFHPTFFWQFFSSNQSCQQVKSPKPQHFHEFFTQKIKIGFLDKKWRFRTVWVCIVHFQLLLRLLLPPLSP